MRYEDFNHKLTEFQRLIAAGNLEDAARLRDEMLADVKAEEKKVRAEEQELKRSLRAKVGIKAE
jgi:hypothetical protein